MHHLLRARRALPPVLAAAVLVVAVEPGSAAEIGPDPSATAPATRSRYTFEDLSLSLVSTRILASQDDTATLVPIGFSFGFYGSAETDLYVSSNGLLSFGGSYDLVLQPRARLGETWSAIPR